MYELILKPSAEKELDRLAANVRVRIVAADEQKADEECAAGYPEPH